MKLSEHYLWAYSTFKGTESMTFFTCALCGAMVAERNARTICREVHADWHEGLLSTSQPVRLVVQS